MTVLEFSLFLSDWFLNLSMTQYIALLLLCLSPVILASVFESFGGGC